ncbi:zinc finger protein 2-like [Leptidea sinapis]|uniref:zinc finger protein 2-like n=1 Tax=Leptidea sinapis TaxID=189913 RepID=UPI0021374252|nr:zinc finger protein 2-like [Leptidea sinapis]
MKMEKIKKEYLLGRCKCCLDDTDLQSMWEEYSVNGESEVYGEMVLQCFGVNWHSTSDSDVICSSCVTRLRDAISFKHEIIASEQLLQEGLANNKIENEIEVKLENAEECEAEYLEININDNNELTNNNVDVDIEAKLENNEEWEEEYLEINSNENDDLAQECEEWIDPFDESDESDPTPDRPKKLYRKDGTAMYKQYTRLELKKALQAVADSSMTRREAADAYNIPLRTLCTKIHNNAVFKLDEEDNKSKTIKFIKEIRKILKNTNATPFKHKAGKYYCAYCSTQGPAFHTGDHLRTHTLTKHSNERIRQVEIFMRPYYYNEILKMDIFDLTCTKCYTKLPEWNDMFQHFADAHDIGFDDAYTKIIPYRITNKLECALCRGEFSAYHVLDSHMNAHYSNYICHQCGETFLTASRLDKHIQSHSRGKFPCEVCGKIFALENYRSKHYYYTHNKRLVYKCLYCTEVFQLATQRQDHMIEKHKEFIKKYVCEFCDKLYYNRQNFRRHMKRKHIRDKKYKCTECNKGFILKYELNSHMIKHNQVKKFFCNMCNEGFTRKVTLRTHLEKVHKMDVKNNETATT